MKNKLSIFIFSVISLNASADMIDSVITKKPIRLYENAQDATPVREITPAELTTALPTNVIAEDGERVKLNFDKQQFWASGIAFKIKRDCKTVAIVTSQKTKDTAVIRGAGNEGGCSK